MGLRDPWRGQHTATRREEARKHVAYEAEAAPDELIELHIVGESYHQDALAAIAGPKGLDGKEFAVGATLRCEPSNPYDANAIRVEVMGQLLGHVGREQAALLSPAIARGYAGCIEGRGLIVGGWRDGAGEGAYGIRVWITTRDTTRLEIAPAVLDPAHRPKPVMPPPTPAATWPGPADQDAQLTQALDDFHEAALAARDAAKGVRQSRAPYRPPAPTTSEMRLAYSTTPTTVTGSADYQDVLKRLPPSIGRMVAELIWADERVEVRISGELVGQLTPKTSAKYRELLAAAESAAMTLTCAADLSCSDQGWKAFIHCEPRLGP